MYCTNCGSKIPPTASFCPGCGTQTQDKSYITNTKSKTPLILFALIALVVVVAVSSFMIINLFILQPNNDALVVATIEAEDELTLPADYEPYNLLSIDSTEQELTTHAHVYEAFYNFLLSPQSFEATYHHYTRFFEWRFEDIFHAELIDFNNNGIPELLIAIDHPVFPQRPNGIIFIITYNDDAQIIKYAEMESSFMARLAESSDGQTYLITITGMGSNFIDYFGLRNNVMENVLNLSFGWDIDADEQFLVVNGDLVTQAQFDNAAFDNLRIINTRDISLDTANSPQNLLAYINSRTGISDRHETVELPILADIPVNIPFTTSSNITAHGRRVAEEFISQRWSLFTQYGRKDLETGVFYVQYENNPWLWIPTSQLPFYTIGGRYRGDRRYGIFDFENAFFDQNGRQIETPPFVSAYVHEMGLYPFGDWTEIVLPIRFYLYDFNNTGIPDIIVYPGLLADGVGPWSPYATLYRYMNGSYIAFTIDANTNFFYDQNDDIIAFVDFHHYFDIHGHYSRLSFTSYGIETRRIITSRNNEERWHQHHSWPYFHEDPNPVMFGSDETLTRIHPLDDLKDEIIESLNRRHGNR